MTSATVQQRSTVAVRTIGNSWGARFAVASATAVTALSSLISTRAQPAARGQPHPVHALLRRFDQVEPTFPAVAARHRQREAPDLADRLGDSVKQVGTVVDQPLAAVLAAGLLLGQEREHQVARWDDTGR